MLIFVLHIIYISICYNSKMLSLNKTILSIVSILVFVGFFTFLSASLTYLDNPNVFKKLFLIQFISIILGFLSIFFIYKHKKINFLSIRKYSLIFFGFSLLLQLAVLVPHLGVSINGATRWLNIGFMTIQPSEIFRFTSILFLANVFYSYSRELEKDFNLFLKIMIPFLLFVGGFYLWIRDIGSLMIFSVSIFAILLFTKIDKGKLFLYSFVSILVLLPLIYFTMPHAKKRIDTYLGISKVDNRADNYQSYNMEKAIGSGQIFGLGYGKSMQKFNGVIPEAVSDSVFSIYAEEFGFLGSVILISLYLWLSILIFWHIPKIKNAYQRYVAAGLSTNILFPAFFNIGTTLAIMPLSGMPLTFISKGGTSIFISLVSVGIIMLFFKK